MNGFLEVIRGLLAEVGVPEDEVFLNTRIELPGYFRAEKKWDLLVVSGNRLIAAIELKSQIGPSFGNNCNNRAEEAIGNATDLWAAYREGAFRDSARPWLGYLMLLEDSPGAKSPVSVKEPHFPVFDNFRGASYATRHEILLTKLVRERLYDAASLLLSGREDGLKSGTYSEPSKELSFQSLATSLISRAIAHVTSRS